MEQQEQINAALREDVDSIKTTMGKLLELFQNLVTKENTPQPPGSTERPELSLPKGYTPPEEGDPNHTPIIIPVTNGDPPPRGVSMLKEASSQPHHATKASCLHFKTSKISHKCGTTFKLEAQSSLANQKPNLHWLPILVGNPKLSLCWQFLKPIFVGNQNPVFADISQNQSSLVIQSPVFAGKS
ncbi:unnamed protein product [Trifolium pratense]|uniref:Uncharacterized protein n=1 Tax=Trifolium pratense TaxID=57577 RepID=A0ACB0LSM3_TRIPR|nr:unnamed protein product [Trifolium pratense]